MKKLDDVKVGNQNVVLSIEDHPHEAVHAIRFTAVCGESTKEGVLTLNVPVDATAETVDNDVREFAQRMAEECAAHERARAAKKRILGQ